MRLVNRTLRYVKPRSFTPATGRFTRSTHWRYGFRTIATATATSVELIVKHDQPQSAPTSNIRGVDFLSESLVHESSAFGKWQWLLTNTQRLAIETDFARKGPAKRFRGALLINHTSNQGDFELWSCLLNYLQRVHGDEGVFKLWNELWGRKTLYKVDSTLAADFWRTIAEAAARLSTTNTKFLDSVFIYAEWMKTIHGTEWPGLYTTVVPHFLRTHQHDEAFRWHLRLSPNFYPGSREFAHMMQQFAGDRVLSSAFTLQSLYIASPERQLYDTLVPHLYGQGQSNAARIWRRLLLRRDDVPLLHIAARPFLRWLRGYWRNITLHPQEAAALGDVDPEASQHSDEEQQTEQLQVTREYMNRIHGKTFGFSAKDYNDQLGARWFASTWVSLDTAVSVVASLGIRKIGPLSLQSIAIRERTPNGVLARFAQLADLGIAVPNTNYVATIRYFARHQEEGLLSDLLHCDLHPDNFEDQELLSRMMAYSATSEDWRTYTLLLASRLAVFEKSTRSAANALLHTCLQQHRLKDVLHVLEDMRVAQIGLDVGQTALMFQYILEHVPRHPQQRPYVHAKTVEILGFSLSLCRRLRSMDVPIPIACWKQILFCAGRLGNIDEVHKIILELLEYYTKRESARPGFAPIHVCDVPDSLRTSLSGVQNLMGVYIPLETPPSSPLHPLAQILDAKMLGQILRWSFTNSFGRRQATSLLGQDGLQATEVGRTISLFRMLRDEGARVPENLVQRGIVDRLTELYGRGTPTKRRQAVARRMNPYSLAQMKLLCEEAWGGDLLPSVEELERKVNAWNYRKRQRMHNFAKVLRRHSARP